MRLIDISEYDYQTMVLAKPIFDSQKRVLLAAGRTINPKILSRLEDIGINFLFVEDEISKGIHIDDMIDLPTWTDSIEVVKDFYEQVQSGKRPDIKDLQKVGNLLLKEVKVRPTLVLIPSGTMAKEVQPYAHAVNVTILSLMTGKKLGYNDRKQIDLAIGSLLHDIGKVLTDEYEKHPEYGFNYIRNNNQLSVVSSHVAYQHHESVDGEGFPRQISGDTILEVGQICGIANLYDNYITQKSMAPHEAMEGIMATSDRLYMHKIVQAFTRAIPTYPPGTKVLIGKGEQAIVTQINTHLHRPIVKVLSSEQEIDLAEDPTIMIEPHSD
ncbi:HD-GYP domain-containing protein [Aquibacillus albus]|uniref:HD-GYP domain-containing protein (C-di-GMP phosphodiesterase class II) n=1 Tax=Aquibacillus albus TaxID=1168171 RepID=A0ABS2N5Y0_9BACI|nr:HD domain-containing phosphohydrolase [Aquibacillus albus]MBM7573527.1 HD-GYP domain-containing protein (c-di-GMP phosphodiesterase class II) [Aquibacillus albus]